jgi:hypothetical protein
MSEEIQKPSSREDEYFAREDIENKRRMAKQHAEKMASDERARLKALHFMHCPKCGMELRSLDQGKVQVEACFNCHGVWLDKGELEQLMEQRKNEPNYKPLSVTEALLGIFRRPAP